MICAHCGKEIQDGITFCPYCGSSTTASENPAIESEEKKMKKTVQADKLKKLIAPAAALAILAAGGVVMANREPTIDLDKYVTITADGYNTVGTLNVDFDTDKLEKDYGKKLTQNFKKAMKNHKDDTYGLSELTANLYDGYETELFVDTCAIGSADKSRNLSNGDVVTYSWTDMAEEAEEAFGVKVKYDTISYTVSGLTSVDTFDAFDGVDVEFSGISPDGRATVNSLPTAEAGKGLYYVLDENSGLSNGDTVTLTVHSNSDNFKDCIEKYGALPKETEKTFTVQGLDEYVTSADDLNETGLTSLQSQAEDVLNAKFANSWDSDTSSLTSMEYQGNYILTAKNGSVWGNVNDVVLVYKVNVHNNYTNYDDKVYDGNNSYYWYISFSNVCVDGDGNVIDGLNDYDTPNDTTPIDSGVRSSKYNDDTKKWNYYGYASIDDLYNAAVTRNVEKYNHQDNVNA